MTALPDPLISPRLYDGVPTKRFLAWCVDVAAIWVLCFLVVVLTAFSGLFFFGFILLAVTFAYRTLTLARGSATWGMRLMAIELRNHHDRRFDFQDAVMHTLGYMISIGMPLAQLASIVMMAGTERQQSLTDMILGSTALNRRA